MLHIRKARLMTQTERLALPWSRTRQLESVLQAQVQVSRWTVEVRVGLSVRFPLELPRVQWVAGGPEGLLPHLEFDQNLCFVQTEGLLIDGEQPIQVIVEALRLALATLRRGWRETRHQEFLEEFGAYWRQAHPQTLATLHSFFTPKDEPLELLAWEERDLLTSIERRKQVKGTQFRRVAQETDSVRSYYGTAPSKPSHTALYVPLPPGAQVVPPSPGRPWTPGYVHHLIRSQLGPVALNQLDALLERRYRTQDLLLMRVSRPGGQGTLVALHLRGLGGGPHLLSSGVDPARLSRVILQPLAVERLDPEFIRARGGSDSRLGDRRVLLVGAGSVGGHLAFMLAAVGVGKLTVVDFDTFSPHNTFRHALGRRAVGKFKAPALAAELEASYPYLEATAVVDSLDRALDTKQSALRLEGFDLVISATGEATAELDLSARLRRIPPESRPDTLYTWLEPLGLGGHCAVLPGGQSGCLRCLYGETEGVGGQQFSLHNQAAFYTPGQHFARDTVGCGSAYTSFADLDARRTAQLSAEAALEVLAGRVGHGQVRSWKGDASAFRNAGFELAPRYALDEVRLRQGMALTNLDCPVCRGSR